MKNLQARSRKLLATLTVRKVLTTTSMLKLISINYLQPKANLSSQVNTLLGLWLTGAAAVLAVYAGCQAELAVFLFAVSWNLYL